VSSEGGDEKEDRQLISLVAVGDLSYTVVSARPNVCRNIECLCLDPRVKPEDDDRGVGMKVRKATAEYASRKIPAVLF